MRTVNVIVSVRLVLLLEDDAAITEVLDDMDYSFKPSPSQASLEDSEILNYEVTDDATE